MSWKHQRGGCLLSLRWWSGGGHIVIMSYTLTIISKLLFYLIYLKILFLFIFFYITEPADRRNDSIMGKQGGKDSHVLP